MKASLPLALLAAAVLSGCASVAIDQNFAEVERFYVPVHSVVRIDEVSKRGPALLQPCFIQRRQRLKARAHSSIPSSPPTTCHSQTRARWS